MTKIEWVARPGTTPEAWNPVTGCTKVSPGCANCYAERMARRLAGRYGYPEAPDHFNVTLHPDRLEDPLHWRKPRTVFVCSMGDLFHEDVSDDLIYRVWLTMGRTQKHTYQVLTKRAQRAREWLTKHVGSDSAKVLPNVWLGVTAENQEQADKRVPHLLKTPAIVRFVSIEPMLGPVDDPWLPRYDYRPTYDYFRSFLEALGETTDGKPVKIVPGVDWVIVGGESGPGARPMHPDWVRNVRDQCADADVPFFFKQWGRWVEDDEGLNWEPGNEDRFHLFDDGTQMYPVGKKRAGHELDGREWMEWPQ